jgi:hypothetical protein
MTTLHTRCTVTGEHPSAAVGSPHAAVRAVAAVASFQRTERRRELACEAHSTGSGRALVPNFAGASGASGASASRVSRDQSNWNHKVVVVSTTLITNAGWLNAGWLNAGLVLNKCLVLYAHATAAVRQQIARRCFVVLVNSNKLGVTGRRREGEGGRGR